MNRVKLAGIVAVVVAVALLLQGGCAAIGYAIGHSADNDKPGDRSIPTEKLLTTSLGTSVGVVLLDGRILTGRLVGLSLAEDDDSSSLYRSACRLDTSRYILPRLADSVELLTASAQRVRGSLLSVDQRMAASGIDYVLKLQSSASDTGEDYLMSRIIRVRNYNGEIHGSSEIVSFLQRTMPPVLTSIAINNGIDLKSISAPSVDHVLLPSQHSGALTGFVVGLAIDIAIAVLAVTSAFPGGGAGF
jgi:small nuclear ribonucleoprotein (snRNP)-like protein